MSVEINVFKVPLGSNVPEEEKAAEHLRLRCRYFPNSYINWVSAQRVTVTWLKDGTMIFRDPEDALLVKLTFGL
jgi:hypothetical protein